MADMESSLVITRIFDAPRETVWNMWTGPEQVMRWWGPKNFSSPSCTMDFRVGGKYLFCMRSESGPEVWRKGIWSTGEYLEIVPLEKIVFTDCFADEQGRIVPSTYYGMEGIPQELKVIVTFEEAEGKTRMTMEHVGMPDKMKDECRTGWNESFDKLAEHLAGRTSQVNP